MSRRSVESEPPPSAAELEALSARVLLALRARSPLAKWQLRDQLGASEAKVAAAAALLRKAGLLHVTSLGGGYGGRGYAYGSAPGKAAPAAAPRGRLPRPLRERYADLFDD